MNPALCILRRPKLFVLLALLFVIVPVHAPAEETPPAPPPEDAFEWTRGNWEGVRRDGADGSEAEMRLSISPFLEGAGLNGELRVVHQGDLYRARLLVAMERETGRWYQIYVNDVDRRFVRLEGEIEESGESGAARSVWRPADPDGERLSKMVSEYLPPEKWRRTRSVSDDGGETWRVLWTDELKRKKGF